ncbi:MAG: hypothetical protein HKO56_07155 [Bacteroidia bacterium]|nr:hypothetical protein [Bacteroidia bacterium]NNC84874.1 hypothetical protein [Bacteroidia bacterium]NNM16418.1 hypothetical protein [Bacteroidia bacterium]
MTIDNNTFSPKVKFVLGVILFAVIIRVMQFLPPNFAPIGAMALFGGTYLTNKKWALALPLIALFLGDVLLEFVSPWGGFHANMLAVYVSFALITCIGFLLRGREQRQTIMVSSLVGSILFFLITNFSVWATGSLFGSSVAGLGATMVAGIPFFKYTVMGDLAFNLIFFGSFAIAKWKYPVLAN